MFQLSSVSGRLKRDRWDRRKRAISAQQGAGGVAALTLRLRVYYTMCCSKQAAQGFFEYYYRAFGFPAMNGRSERRCWLPLPAAQENNSS
jgi:hypothetical protein